MTNCTKINILCTETALHSRYENDKDNIGFNSNNSTDTSFIESEGGKKWKKKKK